MNSPPPGKTVETFVNLDFIRSIAVLLVASAHLLLYLGKTRLDGWSGMTGVCIFFVHTSLVLMWSLQRDGHVGRFYLRRAFRIYPLWLVVLALTVWTHLPMSPIYAPEFRFYHASLRELLWNVALLFNVRYGANVVGASWTLPIEVQMYLFLPCLFFFARQLRQLWPLLALDGFVIWYDYMTRGAVDSSLPMCVPYFLPGIMAYVLKRRGVPFQLPSWIFPLFVFALVGIDHSFGSFRHSWLFCLLLGLAIPCFQDMTSKPVRILSHYVARYSYGIYLSHIAAIGVSLYVLRSHSVPVRLGAFVLLFVGLPIVFYHIVEEPMIRVGARWARRIGSGGVPRITDRELELEMVP